MRDKGRIAMAIGAVLVIGFSIKMLESGCETPSRKMVSNYSGDRPESVKPILAGGTDGITAMRTLIYRRSFFQRPVALEALANMDAPELLDDVINSAKDDPESINGDPAAKIGMYFLKNIEPERIAKLKPLLEQWTPGHEIDSAVTSSVNMSDPSELEKDPGYMLLRAAEACGKQEVLARRITDSRWMHPIFNPAAPTVVEQPTVSDPNKLSKAIQTYRLHHSADQTARRLLVLTQPPPDENGRPVLNPEEVEHVLSVQVHFSVLEAWCSVYIPAGATSFAIRPALSVFCANNSPLSNDDREFARKKLLARGKTTKMIFDAGIKGVPACDEHYDLAVFYLPGFMKVLMERKLWTADAIRKNKKLNEHFLANAGLIWNAASPAERTALKPILTAHLDWIVNAARQTKDRGLYGELIRKLGTQEGFTCEDMESWSDSLKAYAAGCTPEEAKSVESVALVWLGLDLTWGRTKVIELLGIVNSKAYEAEVRRLVSSGNAWRQISGLQVIQNSGRLCSESHVKLLAKSKSWEVRRAVAMALRAVPETPSLKESRGALMSDKRLEVQRVFGPKDQAPSILELDYTKLLNMPNP